jgi:hypothetical protein
MVLQEESVSPVYASKGANLDSLENSMTDCQNIQSLTLSFIE